MRDKLLAAVLALSLIGVGACDDDDDDGTGITEEEFIALLNGANERPNPVNTTATGGARFEVQEDATVDFNVEVDNIDNVILAHIHLGTAAEAGPIVVTLFEGGPTGELEDETLAEGTFDEDDIEGIGSALPISFDSLLVRMRNGTAYVNVHSSEFPAGEIRGQIQPD